MTIDFDSLNIFKKFKSYVPWFSIKGGNYSVIVQPSAKGKAFLTADPAVLKNNAIDAFIEFYLPEFYPFIYNKGTSGKGYSSTYNEIRQEISDNLEYVKTDTDAESMASPLGPNPKYLFSTTVGGINFKKIRIGLLAHGLDEQAKKAFIEEIYTTRPTNDDCPDPDPSEDLPTYSSGLPGYADARGYFNDQQKISGVGPTVNIVLEDIIQTTTALDTVLANYAAQLKLFPAPLRIPLDLESIRVDARRYMSKLVEDIRRDMNLSGLDLVPFGEDDKLVLQLDARQRIKSARYQVDMGSDFVDEPLKVGLFSLLKYNASSKDRWLMSTIASHQRIIREANSFSSSGPGLPSVISFIQSTYGKLLNDPTANPSAGKSVVAFSGPVPGGIDPLSFNKIFAPPDAGAPIDLANPASFAKKIGTFMSAKEVGEIQAALEDPKVLTKLYSKSANKQYSTKIDLEKLVEKILDMIKASQGASGAAADRKRIKSDIEWAKRELTKAQRSDPGGPAESYWEEKLEKAEAKLNKSKSKGGVAHNIRDINEIINQILAMFGIDELINEALICLTMGSTFSLGRINHAVDFGFSIAEFVEDYQKPKLPRPMLVMPSFPPMKIGFNIMGDPPLSVQIRDIILQALIELVFDIIKGLAEMIKHNCNNLLNRPEQEGVVDASEAMKNNLLDDAGQPTPIHTPSMQQLLDEAFATHGLDQDKGFGYLTDISLGLTPFEICQLYNSPAAVGETTIEKIRIFNQKSADSNVRAMQSRSQVLSFFASIAPLCDISSVCAEYINNVDLRAGIENYCLNEADLGTLADQENIQKLASYLADGIPVNMPAIDLLCPDSENFVPSPIISRVIPRIFNTVADNVKMQFVYSVEASRTTLLEPKVTAGGPDGGGAAGLFKALALTLPDDHPGPPKMDPTFIKLVANIFDQLQSPSFAINPEACSDINMDKFGVTLEEFLDALPTLSGILRASLHLAAADIGHLSNTMDNIQTGLASAGPGATPYVSYIFPTRFYNNFAAMARQSPPEYIDIRGTSKPNDVWLAKTESPGGQTTFYSKMYKDASTNEYGYLRMTYRFLARQGSAEHLRISFYSNDDIESGRRPAMRLRCPPGLLPGVDAKWLTANVPDDSFTPLSSPSTLANMGTESDFNPYIYNFTYPLQRQLSTLASNSLSTSNKKYLQNKLQKQVYPVAFNGMIKRTFDYIMRNGIFNMIELNKLNLFKDNTNCEPADQGDLLDIGGILHQAKKNFRQSSCNDEGTPKDLASDALKLALVNLLIQVYLVEFLIKNIFAISAFKLEEILTKPLFKELLLGSISAEIEERLSESRKDLKEFIYTHFEILLQRAPVIEAGGVTHSFAPDEVVPFLTAGTDVREVEFTKLLGYLIEERLGHTYEVCGEMINTMQSINNILAPAAADISFEDAFITDILGVYKAPYGRRDAPMKAEEGRIFFAKYVYWDQISNWGDLSNSQVIVPWDPKDLEGALNTNESAAARARRHAIRSMSGQVPPEAVNAWIVENVPRHELTVRNIFGNQGAGAMPISTTTAVDFLDIINMTEGELPIFEGLKVGYKLMFNFPAYRGPTYEANDWDQSNSPFINSFKPGPVRELMKDALELQGRATGRDTITDSAQSDLNMSAPGAQILGDLLTVDIYSLGDFDPNNLSDSASPGGTTTARGSGMSMGTKFTRIKSFNKRPPTMYLSRIKNNAEYIRFINQTFNPEITMMLPVLYNLGLTSQFFPGIEKNFETTKKTVLSLFDKVSSTNRAPALIEETDSNSHYLATGVGSAGASDMNNLGREFILKALMETPIKILKGIVELIDPHVAISKIIRDITGMIFLQISGMIDDALSAASSSVPDAAPEKVLLDNITGEDLLALGFCGLNTMNAAASGKVGDLAGMPGPLLGPKMTLNGIDFTGTISGLFMIPPSPFGIIYILLMLLDQMKDGESEMESGGTASPTGPKNVADTESSNVC
jgi:hypothetical protein